MPVTQKRRVTNAKPWDYLWGSPRASDFFFRCLSVYVCFSALLTLDMTLASRVFVFVLKRRCGDRHGQKIALWTRSSLPRSVYGLLSGNNTVGVGTRSKQKRRTNTKFSVHEIPFQPPASPQDNPPKLTNVLPTKILLQGCLTYVKTQQSGLRGIAQRSLSTSFEKFVLIDLHHLEMGPIPNDQIDGVTLSVLPDEGRALTCVQKLISPRVSL